MSDRKNFTLVSIPTSPKLYIQWWEDGHSRRRSTGTTDRDEAEAILRAFALEACRRPTEPVEVRQLLDLYIAAKDGEIASIDRAVLAVKHLKAFFGATLVDDAGPFAQDRYVAARRAAKVKDDTIARELVVLSAAFNYAVSRERIERAPAMVQLKKGAARQRWLTRPEAARILAHFRRGAGKSGVPERKGAREKTRHLLLFTRLALYTGARTGAILDLTWDRVDFDQALIWYPLPDTEESNKKRAVVPIDPTLVRMLRAAKRRNDRSKWKNDHVISWRGQRCDRIVRAFRNHMVELKLDDVTPHILRHTCATWMARKGISLFDIGGILGQSAVSTTARYAKHQPGALRDAISTMRKRR